MRSHGDKTMFDICCNSYFLWQPDLVNKYLWHTNHPGFARSNLHMPSCTVTSLTPYNIAAVGLYHLWRESKAHSPMEETRDKSSNWLGLAIIRLLCCEHIVQWTQTDQQHKSQLAPRPQFKNRTSFSSIASECINTIFKYIEYYISKWKKC